MRLLRKTGCASLEKSMAKKRGRPTTYTTDIGDRICELMAEGVSAVRACKEVGVPMRTFYAWQRDNKAFSAQVSRARDDQADTFADQMCDIAEYDEDVQRAKLKIDARKWVASRMKPKSWGDRQQLEHTGADGTPLSIRVEYTDD